MASVPFTLYPPTDPGITKLHIFESAAKLGPFLEIDSTTAVGTYPDYIESFTTILATDAEDWFAIQWENADGVLSSLSAPIKGNTSTLVGDIIERVLQRDRFLNRNIVRQEVEAVIERVLGLDPYEAVLEDIPVARRYQTLTGLTYLAMVRSYISMSSSSSKNVSSATLGLVSFREESGTERKIDLQALIDLANAALGISTSLILQMEDVFVSQAWISVMEP